MIVTLMVNSACNLRCKHCYLPAGLANTLLPENVIEWIFTSRRLDAVILVGMEPLMNSLVARVSHTIGQRCEARNIPFSIITNGMTLTRPFAEPVLRSIAATGGVVDISLDGGPMTYDRQGGCYQRIQSGMQQVLARIPNLQICILNTIWRGWDKERVDDSVAVLDRIPEIHRIQYSLYVDADRIPDARCDNMSPLTAQQAMMLLQTSSRFMEENRCVLVLDKYNARAESISIDNVRRKACDITFPLRNRKKSGKYAGHLLLAQDPIDSGGYLRVHPATAGPIMLSPWDSLHTARYAEHGVLCRLNQRFDHVAQEVVQRYRSRYPRKQ